MAQQNRLRKLLPNGPYYDYDYILSSPLAFREFYSKCKQLYDFNA